MSHVALAESLETKRLSVDAALVLRLPSTSVEPCHLHKAIHHAVLTPGKRLRPILSLAVAELAGKEPEAILDTACAVEFVHTASLILDDLPCMDDAAARRGEACTHHAFGEATAILAAMALVTQAFDLIAQNAQSLGAPEEGLSASRELARCIGTQGIISGQHIDLKLMEQEASIDELTDIYHLKAGALFAAALVLPARLLRLDASECSALAHYAGDLGLAFQIADDLIDAHVEEADASRTSFSTHLGREGAQGRVRHHIDRAVAALTPFGDRAATLRSVAELVLRRAT